MVTKAMFWGLWSLFVALMLIDSGRSFQLQPPKFTIRSSTVMLRPAPFQDRAVWDRQQSSIHSNPNGSVALRATGTIGFLGHSGLLLASTVLVKLAYALFLTKETPNHQQEQQQPTGMLNRCPWPFIVFHDPKQFLKDSPTWVIVLWASLWRLTKMIATRRA